MRVCAPRVRNIYIGVSSVEGAPILYDFVIFQNDFGYAK